jgi:hypothetical protein
VWWKKQPKRILQNACVDVCIYDESATSKVRLLSSVMWKKQKKIKIKVLIGFTVMWKKHKKSKSKF